MRPAWKNLCYAGSSQTLRDRGQEVVAGYIEPHDRPATLAMAEGLETLPPFMVEYKGIRLRNLIWTEP